MQIKLYDSEMMPTRAHPSDAGLDLKSCESVALKPGLTQMIDTGVSVAIPEGYVGLLFSRSSYAKQNITLANSVGVIDSLYRGHIKVPLIWHADIDTEDVKMIMRGDKIAQLVVIPISLVDVVVCDVPDEQWMDTERGDGGFGSTGV